MAKQSTTTRWIESVAGGTAVRAASLPLAWFSTAVCIFALFAPTTCFLQLTVGSNLRVLEEHETHAQPVSRQSVSEVHRKQSNKRVPGRKAAGPDRCFAIASLVSGDLRPRHCFANGVSLPLLC